jgi:hypothetical protein
MTKAGLENWLLGQAEEGTLSEYVEKCDPTGTKKDF